MRRATARFFFCPAPWGPGEGPKGQISSNIIKTQLQSQFERFFNQTVCVFSHMKDIKHIDGIFIWRPESCPRGRTLGYRGWFGGGGGGGSKNFFSEIQPDLVCEFLTLKAYAPAPFLGSPPPGALGRGQKVKYH